MTNIDFDTSELRAFVTDLGRAPVEVSIEVPPIVKRGAQNIKTQLVSEMSASNHFKGTASSMSYETIVSGDGIEALIGPDKDRDGGLAHIAYWGTSKGGGTVADPKGALDAEAPNVERFIADAMAKALE